jgi:hypothetical protein
MHDVVVGGAVITGVNTGLTGTMPVRATLERL